MPPNAIDTEPPRVCFWEESRNVQSSTRGLAILSMGALLMLTWTACRVALAGLAVVTIVVPEGATPPSSTFTTSAPAIIMALGAFAAPIVAGMFKALDARRDGGP